MLNKFMDKIVTERHHLILEEEDVTRVIGVINNSYKYFRPVTRAGHCNWADDPKKWYVHFTVTREKWNIIRHELNVVRMFTNTEIPINTIGVIYTTD